MGRGQKIKKERIKLNMERDRNYKVAGDPTDPHIIKLVHPNNRIFRKARVVNVRRADKKPLAAELVLDQNSHGLLFTRRVNSKAEVCGFVDESTGLFVIDRDGDPGDTAHIKFLKMASQRAKDALSAEMLRQGREDEEIREAQDYYPSDAAEQMLNDYLYNPAKFNADMRKQLSDFASRPLPNVNEYMVFADDAAWNQDIYVTAKVPYRNPANRVLTQDEIEKVDRFLDVFFDTYNKQAFSWYMGAALLNLPIYDERISRMAVMSSSHGGSGKSSLMAAITNAVFTEDYSSVKDDFDRFFLKNNRFSTDSLPVRRLIVYSEAAWGVEKDGKCDHNFDGLNTSAIKSLITDGFITKEPKFGEPVTVKSSGLHLVLTNYLPAITPEDLAMRRRILPILMRPTSMVDKAEKLGLVGRDNLEKFVKDNAEIFAAYFVKVFRENEQLFVREEYSFEEESEAALDSQMDLDEESKAGREALAAVKAEGFIKFIKMAQDQTGLDMSKLIEDAQYTVCGKAPDGVDDHMRREGDSLYIDGSKSFLMRYGRAASTVRSVLQDYYGQPLRKYHKRMFVIPLAQSAKKQEENTDSE